MVKLYHIFLIDLKQVEGNIVLLLCLGEWCLTKYR